MTKGRKPNPHCTACGVLKTDENTYRPASGNLRNICKACYAKKYRASRTTADLLIFRQQYVEHIEAIDAILNQRERKCQETALHNALHAACHPVDDAGTPDHTNLPAAPHQMNRE